MTIEEIRETLDNTKVYVNGKSKELQEKLFAFGYRWNCENPAKIMFTDKPFLLIYENGNITWTDNMYNFTEHKNREISADKILSLEITEPSYRPFKNKDECWDEMQKHKPFGWIYHKLYKSYAILRLNISDETGFADLFTHYTFTDGTPFGIKDE